MTKSEIVAQIAKNIDVKESIVLQIVESFTEIVKVSLENNNNIYLRGFGSFEVKHRSEKKARNISKNTTIVIPAHSIPAFKPSSKFVDEVKNKQS